MMNFKDFINESTDIKLDISASDLVDVSREEKIATEYKFNPYKAITVTDMYIDFPDDYNGEAEIKLSNGDKITYKCKESRTRPEGYKGAPPYYSVSVTFNIGKHTPIVKDTFDGILGETSSITSDLLNAYEKEFKNCYK